MPPPDKPKPDRLKETIRILKQLNELGYSVIDTGYNEVKRIMTQWVNDGIPVTTTVEFTRQSRVAELSLPKEANKTVTLRLKVIKIADEIIEEDE